MCVCVCVCVCVCATMKMIFISNNNSIQNFYITCGVLIKRYFFECMIDFLCPLLNTMFLTKFHESGSVTY